MKHAGVQFLEYCPNLTGSTRTCDKILSNNRDNVKKNCYVDITSKEG